MFIDMLCNTSLVSIQDSLHAIEIKGVHSYMSFLTHSFVNKESVPKEQEMFLQHYSVASIETCVTKTF